MACVLDHQSDIVIFRKLDCSRDMLRAGCVDSIRWKVAEVALRIVLKAERRVNRSASFDERIAVACWKFCQPSVVRPVERDVLTFFTVVADALVA